MDALVEIAFKGNRKEFFRWTGDEPLAEKARVIVEADRGEDLGVVYSIGELARLRNARLPHGTADAPPARSVLRVASETEIAEAAVLRERDDEQARHRARELVQQHGLLMKVTDAEWQLDRMKLTLYFTAEKRVDFRALVRDLASTFRARIELKQIGVRDEARRLSGIGRCGREYCSASWLPELLPINLGIAKDQRLSLNPTQISGACGRLMCCLRFEHEFYVQSRKRFPKEGRILVTSVGEEKVIANDIFRESVRLRNSEGDVRDLPLLQLKRELAAANESPLDDGPPQTIGSAAHDPNERVLPVMREAVHQEAGASGTSGIPVAPHAPNAPTSKAAAPAEEASITPADVEATAVPAAPDVTASSPGTAAGAPQAADAEAPEEHVNSSGENEGSRRRHRRGRRGGRRSRGHGSSNDSASGGRSPDDSTHGSTDNPSDR